jgi:hypothetical protein
VNYGLRWEPYLPEHNSNDHVESFSMANFLAGVKSSVYINAPAGMIFDGDPGFPSNHYTYGQKNLFEPRLGIILDPAGDGKMSIRAGYGFFYDSPQLFFNTRYSNSPPYGDTITPAANSSGSPYSFANPWATYPGGDPFPALLTAPKSSPFPTGGVYVNSPLHPKEMYLQQWNIAVQRQMGPWLFGATYLGNTTKHLATSYEANPGVFIPGTSTGIAGSCGPVMTTTATGLPKAGTACSNTSNLTFRRLLYQTNPTNGVFYSTIGTLDDGGIANYNGALISVRRQTTNFNVSANYTYAHCLSEQETTELTGPSYAQPPSYNPLGRVAGYSNCDSQRRHVANVSLILHSPKFHEHYVNAVGGNWQLSTIFTATSGSYGSIGLASTSSQSGTGNELAISNGASPYTNARTRFGASNYLSPTSFSLPAQGTYSTTKPLTIVGPSSYELDMSLARTFRIPRTDNHQFQFRVEAFNVPNEAIFSGAATGSITSAGVFSGTAGSFTGTGSPRIMQAAAKYIF